VKKNPEQQILIFPLCSWIRV